MARPSRSMGSASRSSAASPRRCSAAMAPARPRPCRSSSVSCCRAPALSMSLAKLSSGQKTRVALAKALLNEPELLLLDEPTASLDPDSGDWVRGYLEDYRDRTGATILLASHNMAEVERLCSQVMMMKEGRIVDRGSPEGLIDRYGRTNLEEVFLHIARGARAELEPVS